VAKSGEIHDHTKSGQLHQRKRNRIKTEPMMMMIDKADNKVLIEFLPVPFAIYYHVKSEF